MVLMPSKLRRAAALCLFLLFAGQAFAQEDGEPDGDPAAEAAADEAEPRDELEEPVDPELDAQGFDPTADDDFVPSEDIPADAPIAFPTDI